MLMALFKILHDENFPTAKWAPLGPWQNWTAAEYEAYFGITVAMAFGLNFGIAVYNAYIGPDSQWAADSKALKEQSSK